MLFKLSLKFLIFLNIFLIGIISPYRPDALVVMMAILVLVVAIVYLLLRPPKALMFSFFLIMLAETKFRERDPSLLLSGAIDGQVTFELVLYGFVLLFTLMNVLSSSLRYLRPTPIELVLFGYVVLLVSSSFWSYNFRITAVRGTQLLILYALCFVAIRVTGSRGVLRILTVSVVLYVLLCSLAALAFPWTDASPLSPTHIPRFSWFAGHPIITAAYAATAAIFIIAEAFFAQDLRQRIMGLPLWLYVIPLILILIETRSRGAIIAFVMAVSVLWMKKYVNSWIGGIVVYIVLALYVISLSSGFTFTRALEDLLGSGNSLMAFLSRGQTAEQLVGVSGRAELWHDVYALCLDRPILGYGYLGARSLLLQVLPWAGHAHNALIETLLGSGVIGTALVWFVLGRTLLSSLLQTPRPTGSVAWQQASILGVLLFLLFHSFVDATFAGAPGYQTLLFFASVSAHGALRPVV